MNGAPVGGKQIALRANNALTGQRDLQRFSAPVFLQRFDFIIRTTHVIDTNLNRSVIVFFETDFSPYFFFFFSSSCQVCDDNVDNAERNRFVYEIFSTPATRAPSVEKCLTELSYTLYSIIDNTENIFPIKCPAVLFLETDSKEKKKNIFFYHPPSKFFYRF